MSIRAALCPVAALTAGLMLCSCGKPAEARTPRSEDAAPKSVRVAPAQLRPMERSIQVVGTLAAHEEATVAAQVPGQIEFRRVDVGDSVKAGQELTLIDTASHQALANQAAASVARAAAGAANAAQNLKRIEELKRGNIASVSELDQALAEDQQARAELKAAEAANAVAQLNLERSRVKAPFDGIVAERVVSVGDYVAVGDPIIRLVKADPLRLQLEVPERESTAVRVGQSVHFQVEGDLNTRTGKLARVAPAIRHDNRMLRIEADVANPDNLRAGLFARARIILNDSDPGVSVPAAAIIAFAGIEKVVVVQDGKAAEKPITTGRRGTDWIEIISGLKPGELVVLNPAGIKTGQQLTVINPLPSTADSSAVNR